jgi:hypothetical protein
MLYYYILSSSFVKMFACMRPSKLLVKIKVRQLISRMQVMQLTCTCRCMAVVHSSSNLERVKHAYTHSRRPGGWNLDSWIMDSTVSSEYHQHTVHERTYCCELQQKTYAQHVAPTTAGPRNGTAGTPAGLVERSLSTSRYVRCGTFWTRAAPGNVSPGRTWLSITPSIPNYNSFDFFLTLSLATRLIQQIYINIIKFRSFLNNFC